MGLQNDFRLIGELLTARSARKKPDAKTLSGQIAILIKYLIATNASRPGAILPGLREGAKALGVNMHTVRRAYQILAEDGYAEITPSVGARVSRFAPNDLSTHTVETLEQFLDRISLEAKQKFGLDEYDLAALLSSRKASPLNCEAYFYECTQGQATMHAEQTAEIINSACEPIVFAEDAPAPRGFSVATLFHLDDIDRLWPGERHRFQFVHINIAPDMAQRVDHIGANGQQITIWESDEVLGQRIARDLSLLSRRDPSQFTVRRISKDFHLETHQNGDNPILVTPRIWNRLPETVKKQENKEQIRYDIEPDDARNLSQAFKHFQSRTNALSRLSMQNRAI